MMITIVERINEILKVTFCYSRNSRDSILCERIHTHARFAYRLVTFPKLLLTRCDHARLLFSLSLPQARNRWKKGGGGESRGESSVLRSDANLRKIHFHE